MFQEWPEVLEPRVNKVQQGPQEQQGHKELLGLQVLEVHKVSQDLRVDQVLVEFLDKPEVQAPQELQVLPGQVVPKELQDHREVLVHLVYPDHRDPQVQQAQVE